MKRTVLRWGLASLMALLVIAAVAVMTAAAALPNWADESPYNLKGAADRIPSRLVDDRFESPLPSITPKATETPEATETPDAAETPQVAETPESHETPELEHTPEPGHQPEPADVPQVRVLEPTHAPEIYTPEPHHTPEPSRTSSDNHQGDKGSSGWNDGGHDD